MSERDVSTWPAPATPAPEVGVADDWPVPWAWWEAIVVFVLAQVLAAVLGAVAVASLAEQYVFPALAAFSSASLAALALLWVRVRHPGALRLLFGPARPTLREVGVGAGLGAGAFLGANVLLGAAAQWVVEQFGGELAPVQQQLQEALRDPTAGPLLAVSVVVLAPLGEELVFRGLLFPGLRRSLRLWAALCLSGFAFSLSHVEPLAILILFPVGVAFAWAYQRRRTLVVPIAAHATFNLITVMLLLFGTA